MSVLYFLARIILYPFFKIFYLLQIKRPRDESSKRGCIICANHISAADPILIGLGMKRRLMFMAKAELWKNKLLKPFLKILAVPVSRGSADLNAIRTSIDMIDRGRALCIFPQGTRTHKRPSQNAAPHGGIGMIASKAKCDIIPAYIYTKDYKLKIFRRIKVIFGDPIRYDELGFEKNNMAEMNNATKLIWDRICMLDPITDGDKER